MITIDDNIARPLSKAAKRNINSEFGKLTAKPVVPKAKKRMFNHGYVRTAKSRVEALASQPAPLVLFFRTLNRSKATLRAREQARSIGIPSADIRSINDAARARD